MAVNDCDGPSRHPHPTRFDDELLADLHAGNLDDDSSAQLWPLVRADADAMRVIAALDSVTMRLRALGDSTATEELPATVAERIEAALLQESGAAAGRGHLSLVSTSTPPRSPWRRMAAPASAAAAAVLLATAGIGTLIAPSPAEFHVAEPGNSTTGAGIASENPPAPSNDLAVRQLGETIDPAQLLGALGNSIPDGFTTEELSECLGAHLFSPTTPLLGSSWVRVGEMEGILLLVPGGAPPAITALIVGANCSSDNPDEIARLDIGNSASYP